LRFADLLTEILVTPDMSKPHAPSVIKLPSDLERRRAFSFPP